MSEKKKDATKTGDAKRREPKTAPKTPKAKDAKQLTAEELERVTGGVEHKGIKY